MPLASARGRRHRTVPRVRACNRRPVAIRRQRAQLESTASLTIVTDLKGLAPNMLATQGNEHQRPSAQYSAGGSGQSDGHPGPSLVSGL